MSRSFDRIRRKCNQLCLTCGEGVCPLITAERDRIAYKKAHRPRFLVFLGYALVYLIGIALVLLSGLLVVRPDLLHEVIAEYSFEVRMGIAIVLNIAGGAIMRTSLKHDIRDKIRRRSQ